MYKKTYTGQQKTMVCGNQVLFDELTIPCGSQNQQSSGYIYCVVGAIVLGFIIWNVASNDMRDRVYRAAKVVSGRLASANAFRDVSAYGPSMRLAALKRASEAGATIYVYGRNCDACKRTTREMRGVAASGRRVVAIDIARVPAGATLPTPARVPAFYKGGIEVSAPHAGRAEAPPAAVPLAATNDLFRSFT